MNMRRDPGEIFEAGMDLPPLDSGPQGPTDPWAALRPAVLKPAHLSRHRVISAGRTDPVHVSFDVLRTRLLRALRTHGWSRVAITSPTPGCGKTFVAANLAFALARQASCRTLVMDLDLRIPNLARTLGVHAPGPIAGLLAGTRTPFEHLLRLADNLAVGLNDSVEHDAAELLQEPATAEALAAMLEVLAPDVVLYDLPPTLACDDVIAFLPQVDGILLVADGSATKAEDIRQCERLFGDAVPLLGVVLNRADERGAEAYGYGYGG